MEQLLAKEELAAFEKEIACLWEQAKIRAPIHLAGGNEEPLINIFKNIQPEDYVFSTHRSHLHALLKGVPKDDVRRSILAGRSISLCFPEHRFYTSAIVAGGLPIACGVAMDGHRVWCFIGDCAAQTGMFSECTRYAERNHLPITFIIEDNGMSVATPTLAVWSPMRELGPNVIRYHYKNTWPHQGTNAGKILF
jgi:TPP-dependent pyruvate/acetoin dehydrogenase alpha subunit